MKAKSVILISSAFVIFAACRTTKNNITTTTVTEPTPTIATTALQNSFEATKYTHGVYPPGNQELSAIQPKYPDVTLATLQQGYTIYSVGKCINCHGSKNIYKRSETQWKDIIDEMAIKANISDAEKDAVYKYVLAIKAAQPK
ncbi:MAG: hypothetical protein ACHQII_07280 [Bacteroidia bacterium]